MIDLPEGVLVDILVRLPVKTLIRCTCVCKPWFALIKSSYFVNRHLSHVQENHLQNQVILLNRYILREHKNVLSFRSYNDGGQDDECFPIVAPELELELEPGVNGHTTMDLCGACNGLVCISRHGYQGSGRERIFLLNPATRGYLALPPVPNPSHYVCTEGLGFGFDPSTKDYKVVRITGNLDNQNFSRVGPWIGAEIYKLSTNSWTKLDIPPQVVPVSYAAVHSGSLHWSAFCNNKSFLSFNLCTELFGEIEYPSHLLKHDSVQQVAVLDQSLACVSIKILDDQGFDMYDNGIEIWVMKEYGIKDSWTKRYSVNLSQMRDGLTLSPPSFIWNDEFLLLRSPENRRLISCSLQDNNPKQRVKYQQIHRHEETMVYQETLVSLEGISESWQKL